MNPQLAVFRQRLRMFPALVSCTTIDWFYPWPVDGLLQVAHQELSRYALLTPVPSKAIAKVCVSYHQTVERQSAVMLADLGRANHVTPVSFMELLRTFATLFTDQQRELAQKRARLANGLDKLRSTEVQVADLQGQLELAGPVLRNTQDELKGLMERIVEDTAVADEMKGAAALEEQSAVEKQAMCQGIRDDANHILQQALPELEAALKVLGQLHISQLAEVARYTAPPTGVRLVMQGVCILMQVAPAMVGEAGRKQQDYWPKAKQLLMNPQGLLDSLVKFDRDNIPEKVIQRIQPLVRSEDFTPEKIKTASTACAAMCQWVHAMYKYHHVALDVAPKRVMLANAEEELAVVSEKLEDARSRLKVITDKLDGLLRQKAESEARAQQLEAEVSQTEVKLERAGRLTAGLASEKTRWIETIAKLEGRERTLLGDALACAAQIAYSGYFPAQYRAELLSKWRAELVSMEVAVSTSCDVGAVLGDPVHVRGWRAAGLPADTLSTENALILANSRRWPYLIDPEQQANRWIRNSYKDALEVLKPGQRDLIRKLEGAIRGGRPVLLEGMTGDIDPVLDPLLLRETTTIGGQTMMRLGENPVPYHSSFRLLMTTKDRRPQLTPEAFVKVCVLDFQVTRTGLEEQLLGRVVEKERADLEAIKSQLVVQTATMEQELKDIQDGVLVMLEDAQGDILDDEELIDRLDQSRAKSVEINQRFEHAEHTERTIDETREAFRPVAVHGTVLYFTVSDLTVVDPMYEYSLRWFFALFASSIDVAAPHDVTAKRVQNIVDAFTSDVYRHVCRSIFERHKLIFSFQLCLNILQANPATAINPESLRCLLSGPAAGAVASEDPPPRPKVAWLRDELWSAVIALGRVEEPFASFPRLFVENLAAWQGVFDSNDPHKEPLPAPFGPDVTPIDRLLVVQAIRPDKLADAVREFVSRHMGPKYIDPPPLELAQCYADSTPHTPLVFVLSSGADPIAELMAFAEQQRMGRRCAAISLGQEQGPRASRLVAEALENGAWVILQNCHLAASWMPALERLVDSFPEHPASSFRLWLTTMPSAAFPKGVLQSAVKMTLEPPSGLRANMHRSITSVRPDQLDRSSAPDKIRPLFFALCYFHAMMQERRGYGPLGFNIPYEFNSGDFKMCFRQLVQFTDPSRPVPFEVITFLFGQINYGGRVTDHWDRRTLMTLLDDVLCPDALRAGYSFSESHQYVVPQHTDHATLLKTIHSWPLAAEPEAFGLHRNAALSAARSAAAVLTSTLAEVHLGRGAAAGASTTAQRDTAALAVADTIEASVPSSFDLAVIRERYPADYNESMNTVLLQEALRFNRLLALVHTTLRDLRKGVRGTVVMSEELEEVAVAFSRNTVPKMWSERAYPSLKPLAAWAQELAQRCAALTSWIESGTPNVVWLSGLYFPQGFLTAVLQNHARREKIAIDRVSLAMEMLDVPHEGILEKAATGVYIHGLFFEGCRWSFAEQSLVEAAPKELFSAAPTMWFKPVVDRSEPDPTTTYRCPVYKTLLRAGTLSTTGHSTNFVIAVDIRTVRPPTHWIKRSAALVCQLNF
eukprot:TRINITY_DN20983_c0_g1_i1.p1 TRINITY_DN20983_c0_g1~~TRINITY_DN20983_c0_g1_i1.p1  ORF type:complete len:1702 (-),score=530.22 TRINITY_DN20983_c0_g1_i1:180-4850(-)